MQLDEVMSWRPFKPANGDAVDLSFLDAHQVTFIHKAEEKSDIEYTFWVTYSFHCFAKDYPELSKEDRSLLMYYAPNSARPFCYKRYELAKKHLRNIIDNLGAPETIVTHAGYGSYATCEILTETGNTIWYFVPFTVYREKKKFRIHVTSAYPLDEKPGHKGKVGFFKIAHNLKNNKKLPAPKK